MSEGGDSGEQRAEGAHGGGMLRHAACGRHSPGRGHCAGTGHARGAGHSTLTQSAQRAAVSSSDRCRRTVTSGSLRPQAPRAAANNFTASPLTTAVTTTVVTTPASGARPPHFSLPASVVVNC